MSKIITLMPFVCGAHMPRRNLGISIFLTLVALGNEVGGECGGPHPHTSAVHLLMNPRG